MSALWVLVLYGLVALGSVLLAVAALRVSKRASSGSGSLRRVDSYADGPVAELAGRGRDELQSLIRAEIASQINTALSSARVGLAPASSHAGALAILRAVYELEGSIVTTYNFDSLLEMRQYVDKRLSDVASAMPDRPLASLQTIAFEETSIYVEPFGNVFDKAPNLLESGVTKEAL